MAYSLIFHVAAAGPNTFSTPPVDSSASNLIVCAVTDYQASTAAILSDSKGNAWTPRTPQEIANGPREVIYDCQAPIVGSGHTFTLTGSSIYGVLKVLGCSGSAATPFDQESGQQGGGFVTAQAGSVTPTAGQNDELIVFSFGFSTTEGTLAVDSGFTISDQVDFAGGNNWGGIAAYKIKTDGLAENPTFTFGAATGGSAVIATYKAAAAAAQDTPELRGRPAGLRGERQMRQLLAQ